MPHADGPETDGERFGQVKADESSVTAGKLRFVFVG